MYQALRQVLGTMTGPHGVGIPVKLSDSSPVSTHVKRRLQKERGAEAGRGPGLRRREAGLWTRRVGRPL